MSEAKVIVVSCPEKSEITEKVAASLAEKGIAYTLSPSEQGARALLAVLDGQNSINTSVAAKVMEAVGSGIPVFSICPEQECCACGETLAMLEKLFVERIESVGEASVIEEPVIEDPVTEEPVIEELVAETPEIEEPVVEDPVIEEPVAEDPEIEAPISEALTAEAVIAEQTPARKCVCGETVSDDMAFCCSCGRKVETIAPEAEPVASSEPIADAMPENEPENAGQTAPESAPAARKCSCGAEILPGTAFCWKCGSRVEAAVTAPEVAPAATKCSCGAEILPDTAFCWNCGKKVGASEEAPTAVPATPKCPGCGADITPGDRFCFSCGTPLN